MSNLMPSSGSISPCGRLDEDDFLRVVEPMQDDEITLCNACADLVSLKKSEAFPLRLLGTKRSGEWIGVREFCLKIGVAADDIGPELFATWLPDPMAQEAYAVIMFYDDESKWSMAAQYNRGRLLDRALSQPTGAAIPASSCPTTEQVVPAAEV